MRWFNSLPEWVAYVADLVKRRRFERAEYPFGTVLSITGMEWGPPPGISEPSPAPATHPVHGGRLLVPNDPVGWPAHWKQPAGC